MGMPDFSFLANRKGDTGIKDAADGFMRAFSIASQAKAQREELKLRQQEAERLKQAQEQDYANKQMEYSLKINEFAQRQLAEETKRRLLLEAGYNFSSEPAEGGVGPANRVVSPVEDIEMWRRRANIETLYGGEKGDEAAKRYSDIAKDLYEQRYGKTGEVVKVAGPNDTELALERVPPGTGTHGSNKQFAVLQEGTKPPLTRVEIKNEEEAFKSSLKQREDSSAKADIAKQERIAVDVVESRLAELATGPTTAFTVPMRKVVADIVGVGEDATAGYTSAESAMKELVLAKIKKTGANPTDTDRKFVESMYSKLQTTDGRRQVADYLTSVADRAVDRDEALQQFADANDGNLYPKGSKSFLQLWNKYEREEGNNKVKAILELQGRVDRSKFRTVGQMLSAAEAQLRAGGITAERTKDYKKTFGYTPWFAYEGFSE